MARSTAKSSRLPWRRAHLSLLAKRQGGWAGDKERKISHCSGRNRRAAVDTFAATGLVEPTKLCALHR